MWTDKIVANGNDEETGIGEGLQIQGIVWSKCYREHFLIGHRQMRQTGKINWHRLRQDALSTSTPNVLSVKI